MATKKAAPKKTAAKRTHSKTKSTTVRSFHVAPRDRPFWTFLFTTQSFYWVLIGAAVLAVGIYVASLQIRINSLYDQVDTNSVQSKLNKEELKKLNQALQNSSN